MDKLDEIISYIDNNRCLIFVGAGLSKIAECYDWKTLVQNLVEHDIIKAKIQFKDIIKDNVPFEDVIDFCEKEFQLNKKENEYWGIVRRIIIKNPKKYVDLYIPLIEQIMKINKPLSIITTNIDSLLEEVPQFVALDRIYYDPSNLTIANLDNNKRSIFHIHGYEEDIKKTVLTKSKYIERYKESWFQKFLTDIITNYSILFIGYSLCDKELLNIFLQIKNNNPSKTLKHFALIPQEDNFTESKITILHDLYCIKTLVYGSRNDFHGLFSKWIDKNYGKL